MSRAALIKPHLPYLRRYARALTGSQERGDKYVLTALETLIEDPDRDLLEPEPKLGLFRSFTKIWQSINSGDIEVDDSTAVADRNIRRITPLPRQAFLLTAVEGFDQQEAAEILGIDREELSVIINQAGREIAEQVGTTVLIIEDEPLIAMDIETMVENLGHTVSGIARTHSEALEMVGKNPPGLVLADIQLADGSSGVDAVNDILRDISVPVIFITGFPERLLSGERPEPAFLVTKPFQPDMVRALISQALFFGTTAN